MSCARREAGITHPPSLKIFPLSGSLVFQSGHQSRSNERAESRMVGMLREGEREEEAAPCIPCAWVELMCNLQGSAKRLCPCLVNFAPAVSYHFCLSLHAAFTQLCQSPLAKPSCKYISVAKFGKSYACSACKAVTY